MKFKIPRLLGDINDSDTQFTATAKKYQEMILLGGIVLIGALAYGGITAYIGEGRSGTWRYGLCKVFLEQYTEYPQSLVILDSGEKQNAAMIGYLATNPYGAQQSQEMECFYSSGPAGITMSRVTINRKPLDLIKTGGTVNANAMNDNQTLSYQDIFNLHEIENRSAISENVSKIHIDEFNKSIPAILAYGDLDMAMPAEVATEFIDLKYD